LSTGFGNGIGGAVATPLVEIAIKAKTTNSIILAFKVLNLIVFSFRLGMKARWFRILVSRTRNVDS
jgi:hypothetical protein